MIRFAALVSVLVLITGQGARASTCRCAPCPFESGGTCDPDPAPPCCGEPEPENACNCAHFASPEGIPVAVDSIPGAATIEIELPEFAARENVAEALFVQPDGPGPPPSAVPLFLRDLSLRL